MSHPRRQTNRLLAEALVIVVSVMLAFAADRWNQGRVDARRAESYSQRLVQELVADSTRLVAEVNGEEDAVLRSVALLERVRGAQGGSETTLSLYRGCTRNAPLPYPGGATFREMQSSGDLGLIGESVRQELFDYYGFVDGSLLRIQDFRRIGRDPITEVAFGMGFWLPDEMRPTDAELTQRLREHEHGETLLTKCVAYHQTTASVLRQWSQRLAQALVTVRSE